MADGSRGRAPAAQHTVATDGDEFMLAIPGVSGRIVRTGRGVDRAVVRAWGVGSARMALLDLGFPATAEAEVVGDSLVLATLLRAPEDGRWDGISLAAGQTYVYPAGGAQYGRDPDGLQFALSVLPWETFEQAADDLGVDPTPATRQHVVRRGPLWGLVAPLADAAPVVDPFAEERLLECAVRTVCGDADLRSESPRTRGWQDADLVHEATAYLERSGEWVVPLLTLCRQVFVSERRLQLAFANLLGLSPLTYMRHRALQAAHRALRSADPATGQVADIARAFGFGHLGRFAATYRHVYGERPSRTLRRTPQ
jgi:AraC-like DNA-binding protein